MGYIRRKLKTVRRVKFASSKKRVNKRKQTQLSRKKRFRKSKRGKRGGQQVGQQVGQQGDETRYERAERKHREEQDRINDIKYEKNLIAIEKNKRVGKYADPFNEWVEDTIYVTQEPEIVSSTMQTRLNDENDIASSNDENSDGPITFGGKKRKRVKRLYAILP